MFDELLDENGPDTIKITKVLNSVSDGALYPPSYAGGVYDAQIDGRFCVLDSYGSQANRISKLFMTKYKELVPQIMISDGRGGLYHILEYGHRIADAALKASDQKDIVNAALVQFYHGSYDAIAKIHPLSYVFGFWDSRGIEISGKTIRPKWERIVTPQIIAKNFDANTNSLSQFSVDNIDARRGIRDTILLHNGYSIDDASVETKEIAQKVGIIDCPGSTKLGGISLREDGKIIREIIINVEQIRTFNGALCKYIAGLSLVSAIAKISMHLRMGCTLQEVSTEISAYYNDGVKPYDININDAVDYAKSAASEFGVGEYRDFIIDKANSVSLYNSGKEKKDKKDKKKNA